MPRAQTQNARNLILDLAEHDRKAGKLISQNGRWRVRLIGRGDIFMDFAAHDLICQVADAMLGSEFVLGGLSAHAIPKDAPPQGVHVDYPYSVMREPFPEPLMQMQAIWVLDGFTADNGPTRVLRAKPKDAPPTRQTRILRAFHADPLSARIAHPLSRRPVARLVHQQHRRNAHRNPRQLHAVLGALGRRPTRHEPEPRTPQTAGPQFPRRTDESRRLEERRQKRAEAALLNTA